MKDFRKRGKDNNDGIQRNKGWDRPPKPNYLEGMLSVRGVAMVILRIFSAAPTAGFCGAKVPPGYLAFFSSS